MEMRLAQNFDGYSHDIVENKGPVSGARGNSHDVTENKGPISEALDNSHDVVDGAGVDSSSHDVAENNQVNLEAVKEYIGLVPPLRATRLQL